MTKPITQENISAMAATMFSFLDDTALYGEGRAQHQSPAQLNATNMQMAPPLRPAPPERAETPQEQPSPPAPVAPVAACLDERGLNHAMVTFQARIISAEKRTALMEQRLLTALDQCQSRRPPAQSGCSWSIFVFVVFVFLGILLVFTRTGSTRALHAASNSLPLVIPNSMPASPLILPHLNAAVPRSFMAGLSSV